ncbi:hypothetical protein CCY99_07210 [Helicobacter sp. 16-1353]|uniref:HlyD family secretion protein n=1 Tax=Helicobacter sp. 16-1353 TaxID=2004996 RepID=UPI000DCF410E|nr:efflux RND transporter periplasmic adaptor subunit [Helicobacter sp. 16-1353]RAX52747.1 hypothetical protein CCY99_07210 [Helicobacter sp. 16-1353]
MKILKITIVGVIILAIAIWLVFSFYIAHKPKPTFIQGQIEATQYSISSKVAGRIEEIFVKKGDFIKSGDLAYSIKSPELEAKIKQAKAGYEAAKALSEETNKGARIETITSAKEVYMAAKAMAELAEKTYIRIQNLYDSGVVSLQKRDEAETNFKSAKYNENTAYQQYKLALDGATKETKEALKQKELAALGTLDEVESYAKDTQAFSPISGEVSNILLHTNELAPSGFPVILVLDTNSMYLRFSITEDKLEKFKIGSEFSAFVPALDKNIRFSVRYISPLGDFAIWKSANKKNNYDMKSYEIEANIIDKIDGLRVGMSVLVED